MTFGEWEVKQLEEELSEKEGRWIKVLSIKGNHVNICSWETYQVMKKEGLIKGE